VDSSASLAAEAKGRGSTAASPSPSPSSGSTYTRMPYVLRRVSQGWAGKTKFPFELNLSGGVTCFAADAWLHGSSSSHTV
jgi:hypothetical protein